MNCSITYHCHNCDHRGEEKKINVFGLKCISCGEIVVAEVVKE